MRWKTVLFTLFAVLCLAACRGRVDFSLDETYSYLTVTLNEEELTELIEEVLTGGSNPLMRTASASARPNEIAVTGEVNDGRGGTVPGTLAVRFWVVNGDLQIAVSEFDFAGFTADTSVLDRFNSDMANGLAQSARQDTSGAEYTALTLNESGLSFTIRTPRNTPVPR